MNFPIYYISIIINGKYIPNIYKCCRLHGFMGIETKTKDRDVIHLFSEEDLEFETFDRGYIIGSFIDPNGRRYDGIHLVYIPKDNRGYRRKLA